MTTSHPYNMKMVSEQTGLTPFVLRAWEKRYNVVTPERTATNRRVYSEDDMNKLCLLAVLTNKGYKIGHLANESLASLRLLTDSIENPSITGFNLPECLKASLDAVKQLDDEALKILTNQALLGLSRPHFIEEYVYPLLNEVGDRWQSGELRVVNEHMCAAVIRGILAQLLSKHAMSPSPSVLLVATPANHLHEIGAMTAGIYAGMAGWRVVYLGPNLPAEEIAMGAKMIRANAIALSLGYPAADLETANELKRVEQATPGIPIICGGSTIKTYRLVLEANGIHCVDSLDELMTSLRKLA